jgi:hypothetical protein
MSMPEGRFEGMREARGLEMEVGQVTPVKVGPACFAYRMVLV